MKDERRKLDERRRQYLESIPGYLPGRSPEDQPRAVRMRLALMPDSAVAALFASCKGEGE